MRLTDVFDGYPGRCHDTSVAQQPNTTSYRKQNAENSSTIPFIGRRRLSLGNFLMVSYKDNVHLTQEQKSFNNVLDKSLQSLWYFEKKKNHIIVLNIDVLIFLITRHLKLLVSQFKHFVLNLKLFLEKVTFYYLLHLQHLLFIFKISARL